MPRLSVIIPTLNEAAALPGMLDALSAQTRPPDEIVVADAGSKDGTPQVAHARGARVVPGGRPGAGRNAGARAAAGDLLLFLDADVLPRPNFIAGLLDEFARMNYAVATCLIDASSDNLSDALLAEVSNLYLLVVQHFSPHAPGFCIVVRREIHRLVGGFDEGLRLAEDHDYVQRAAQHGEFGVITGVRIPVSMRRLEKEGLTRLAIKYLWCEMHALAGRPIYSTPFKYEFGNHNHTPAGVRARRLVDVGQLRERLGHFDNPLQSLSVAGLSRLENLVRADWVDATRHRVRLALDSSDLASLHRYLLRRLAVIRLAGRPLRSTLYRLQTLPLRESIRLIDLDRLRARLAEGPWEAEERR